jgi:uncharacterized protein
VIVRGVTLAKWARACVREQLGGDAPTRPSEPWCEELGATFVTLRWRRGALQGCIGSIRQHRAIVDDVARNAVAAATRDSRGQQLALADVDQLDVEVSILSALEPIVPGSETEMWAAITPGSDGVVLEYEDCRGVLLPVVWEKLPTRPAFAEALKQKAGLARSFWSDQVRLFRYSVEHAVDRAS